MGGGFSYKAIWSAILILLAAGRGALIRVRAGGNTIFTSVSVVSPPRNGTLSSSGLIATYTPKSGFKGSDQYVIKVCGNRSGSPGCSTLTYAVTVQ